MTFRNAARRWLDREPSVIERAIRARCADTRSLRVLDVGCGFGRNLMRLERRQFDVVGVDSNAVVVSDNRSNGMKCFLPTEEGWKREYDILLMSHVIEHLAPTDLIQFMESYLEHLKQGGFLIIATPLLTDYFFDDFTHVKPYHPESLMTVFGRRTAQTSIHSDITLDLLDVTFRRSAYKIRRSRAAYLRGAGRNVVDGVNAILALLHLLSFGYFGKKDGWVGVFRKIS